MAVLNALALDGAPDPATTRAFAALVGGDLGPRLLPIGSLAALLWCDLLRRHGVAVPLAMFIRVGVALTVPTLAVVARRARLAAALTACRRTGTLRHSRRSTMRLNGTAHA